MEAREGNESPLDERHCTNNNGPFHYRVLRGVFSLASGVTGASYFGDPCHTCVVVFYKLATVLSLFFLRGCLGHSETTRPSKKGISCQPALESTPFRVQRSKP